MKSFQLPTAKQFYIAFILVSAASITGPYISFDSRYHGTQVIRHPVEVTKDVIKDANYVIVFDGGSTGTRIHIFSFLINQNVKQKRITLDQEHFFHTAPGLSSYFYNATLAATSLDPLLRKAFDIVPSLLASQTPAILKATAGLRLLSDETANEILKNVEFKLESTPFKVAPGSVSMLADTDEGLFAWYTVNFLLEKLHKINESIVALDLGGGSTQITFSTNNVDTLVKSSRYIVQRNIEGELEFIYTYSYLGNGLMAARKSILLQNFTMNTQQIAMDGHSCDERWRKEHYVMNPCFKILSNTTYTWKQDHDVIHIHHNDSMNNSWEQCLDYAKRFIRRSAIDKPKELRWREIFAMSYFYDRMKDIKVIREESGQIKVRDYFRYAEIVCNGSIKMKKQNVFLCLDLTYIGAYLHYGLGLSFNKDITLVKKIGGIETSWALGAAINMFAEP